MIISRLFRITLFAGLIALGQVALGQGAQAMLTKNLKFALLVPSFTSYYSTNIVSPQSDAFCVKTPESISVKKGWLDSIKNYFSEPIKIKRLKNTINSQKKTIAECKKLQKTADSKYKTAISQLKKKHTQKIDELKTELAKKIKQDGERETKLTKEYAQKIKDLNIKYQKERDELNAQKTLEQKHIQEIDELKTDIKNNKERENKRNKEHEQEITRCQQNCNTFEREYKKEVEIHQDYKKRAIEVFKKIKTQQDNNRKKRQDSKNKQNSWWDTTKKWAFKKFVTISSVIGLVWYPNTPSGREKNDRFVAARLLEYKLVKAIEAHDLKALKAIIESYKTIIESYKNSNKLDTYINGEKLAQLALAKDSKGEDFIPGLALLLEKEIVQLANIYHKFPNKLTLSDKTTVTFETCTIKYNIFQYVKSVEAFNFLVKYHRQIQDQIVKYNNDPENKIKMVPLALSELLNQLIDKVDERVKDSKPDLVTIMDLYTKLDSLTLVEAAKKAGALDGKTVYENALKYLGVTDKGDRTELNKATVAIDRKLVPQKPAEPKPEDKKPEEKKPEDKKPEEKK